MLSAFEDAERTEDEVERDRLLTAGALHNSACQSLSGLQLFAATLARRLPGEPTDLSEDVGELAKLLGDLLEALGGETQSWPLGASHSV